MPAINASKIVFCTHTARLTDHAADADVHLVCPDDGVPERWWASRGQDAEFMGTDKDLFHADLAQAFVRDDAEDRVKYLMVLCAEQDGVWNIDPRLSDAIDPPLPAQASQKDCARVLSERLSQDEGAWPRLSALIDERVDGKGKIPKNEAQKLNEISRASLLKIRSMFSAQSSEKNQAVQALHAARRRGQEAQRLQALPVPKRLKQIVVPGPGDDVVLTLLAPLPLLRKVGQWRLAAGKNLKDRAVCLRRFRRFQAGITNTQNTGIPQGTGQPLYGLWDMAWTVSHQPLSALRFHPELVDAWIAAWGARRAWIQRNGLPADAPTSTVKSDLNRAVQVAGAKLIEDWCDQTGRIQADVSAVNFLIDAARGRPKRGRNAQGVFLPWGQRRTIALTPHEIQLVRSWFIKEEPA